MSRILRKRKLPTSRQANAPIVLSTHPFLTLTRSIGKLQKQLALIGLSQNFDTSDSTGCMPVIDFTGFLCEGGESETAEVRAIKRTEPLLAADGLDQIKVWGLLDQYMPYFRRTEFDRVKSLFENWWKQIEMQRKLRLSLVPHAQKILPPLEKTVIESLEAAIVNKSFEDTYALAKEIRHKIKRLKTLVGDRQGKHTNQDAHRAERELVRTFLFTVPDQNYAEACRRTWKILDAWSGHRAPKDWESIQARHRDLIPAKNRKHRARTHRD